VKSFNFMSIQACECVLDFNLLLCYFYINWIQFGHYLTLKDPISNTLKSRILSKLVYTKMTMFYKVSVSAVNIKLAMIY